MSGYYLGIDVGTYETKGVIVTATGDVLTEARRAHRMQVPQAGHAEHDAERDWWGEFADICAEMIRTGGLEPADVRAVGASGIGPCMLPVDAAGTPLMNAVLYGVDTRAADEIDELTASIGEEALLASGGNALTSQSVGPKILWLRRNRPDVFERAACFLNSTSFLVRRLTGETVIDHYSAAGFNPLYDIARMDWTDTYDTLICGRDRLARLAWTTDVVGGVTAEAARRTGLAEGTPVIAGTIDAASEAVSVGVRRPGQMMLMYGSTVFGIEVTAERVQDPRLWYAPWLFAGQHASMSGLATSGTLTHWFVQNFARELDPREAMGLLAHEAAASPPGARGLIVLPYFSGERTPLHDPHAKGMIFGLDLTHGRGDVYRGLIEGIAYGVRHILETYDDAGARPETLTAVGGGTRNPVWLQAVSDITGRSQSLRHRSFGASYGNAFLAAVGVGDADAADMDRWNPVAREIRPDAALSTLYDAASGTYRQLYARTRDLMRAGESTSGARRA
ncbi:FGGY-family carbohydrate kinase [Aureimonas altamirensis]|uniref:FGGY-family carbohydrate kinase n=1 Tax=Aureimonas altamirensis TaxID=370622 RepID=UPI0020367E16|nr:FGGY-family carbohydrate kinase [Aureimonas altamirensis]